MKREIRKQKKKRLAKLKEKLSQKYEIEKAMPGYQPGVELKSLEDEISKIEKELKEVSPLHNPNPWIFNLFLIVISGVISGLIGYVIGRFS